jgi:hypothetical protein
MHRDPAHARQLAPAIPESKEVATHVSDGTPLPLPLPRCAVPPGRTTRRTLYMSIA